MKFNVDRSELVKGLNTVSKAISNRTTLPILENIYIELTNDQLILRGNDLELGIQHGLSVSVLDQHGPNGILIKADTLIDIVSKINSETISIEWDDLYKCQIKAGAIDFDIFGLPCSEYPQFPTIEKNVAFDIKLSDLSSLIRHTIFSVSYDETKQFLNGIKIESADNRCDFISTDGFRLSVKYLSNLTALPAFSCIVPYKTMNELSKILPMAKNESVNVFMSERQISFQLSSTMVVSRLINGRFPDYKQVIPSEARFKFQVSRQTLLSASERANIIAIHSNYVGKFEFSESALTISSKNAKLGDYEETIAITRLLGTDPISVTFNIKLMQEALRIIEQSDIVFEMNSELSPCVIHPVGDETFTHILMPIRMSEYSNDTKVVGKDSSVPETANT